MTNPEQARPPFLLQGRLYKLQPKWHFDLHSRHQETSPGNVTSFKGISDSLAQLGFKINSKYHLWIIQAYLPTCFL